MDGGLRQNVRPRAQWVLHEIVDPPIKVLRIHLFLYRPIFLVLTGHSMDGGVGQQSLRWVASSILCQSTNTAINIWLSIELKYDTSDQKAYQKAKNQETHEKANQETYEETNKEA